VALVDKGVTQTSIIITILVTGLAVLTLEMAGVMAVLVVKAVPSGTQMLLEEAAQGAIVLLAV
jgi:hypothetical protein